MRYIGIDYGSKRIGVAVSDEAGRVAFPLVVVPAGQGAVEALRALAAERAVEGIVLGESQRLGGEPNAVQKDIERFKKELEEATRLPVEYERELYTSAQAARQYAPDGGRGKNPSQEHLDASAAALILQAYLDRAKRVE